MTALLLDPHGDDAALFAAYICQREPVHVWVNNPTVPDKEINAALKALGTHREYASGGTGTWEIVYSPAYHREGHDEHNNANRLASLYWPEAEQRHYCTYAPRAVRQTGTLVEPEWWMIAPKLRALSCFPSQIEQASTRPWFTYLLDLREWISET